MLFFVCALMFGARVVAVWPNLPQYSIDENEVVETAASMLGGDYEVRLYKYGPLTMYGLASLYAVAAKIPGHSPKVELESLFFNPTFFYALARIFDAVLIVLMAWILYVKSRKHFGEEVAILAGLLLTLPLIENMTRFTVRIDVTLCFFHLLAWLTAIDIAVTNRRRDYILFGVFTGLAVASKPLPGLLVVPVVFIAHFLAHKGERIANHVSLRSLSNLALCFLFLFAAHSVGNPYSVLNFVHFIEAQVSTIGSDSILLWSKGYDLSRFLEVWGWTICILFLVSIIGNCFKTDRKRLIVICYVLCFFAAFSWAPAQTYFYIPLVPPLCLLAAEFILSLFNSENLRSRKAWAVTIILILAFVETTPNLRNRFKLVLISKGDFSANSSALASKKWIEENIPSNTKLLYYGLYPYGPRVVASSGQTQGEIGQYFWFGKGHNKFYADAFKKAYKNYRVANLPVYEIFHLGAQPGEYNLGHGSIHIPPEYLEPDGGRFVGDRIADLCRDQDIEYLVAIRGISHDEFAKEEWLKKLNPQLIASFAGQVSIYKLSAGTIIR
jgi:hypothetical protein